MHFCFRFSFFFLKYMKSARRSCKYISQGCNVVVLVQDSFQLSISYFKAKFNLTYVVYEKINLLIVLFLVNRNKGTNL